MVKPVTKRLFAGLLALSFVVGLCYWHSAAKAATTETTSAAAETHGTHGESNEGDVPMSFRTDLALWSVVTFLVFLFVLKKLAWKPMLEGLQKREAHILNERKAAEEARQKAEQLLAEHEQRLAKVQDEVREMLAQAKQEAEQAKEQIIQQARAEAEQTRQKAVAEIERARDDALKDIFRVVSSQVVEATERVLGRALTDEDQQRLVQEALSELQNAGRG